jgi:hypothetical protein
MGEESPKPANTPTGAVFLSYASQDAEAAQRICAALRSAGVEVWFDQSELRGGDAWDRQIRRQIRECTLFVPIISANSQARPEGYFRLEWDLADQRSHLMGRSRALVVPVCTDATPEREADVPDSFVAVQWDAPARRRHAPRFRRTDTAPAVPRAVAVERSFQCRTGTQGAGPRHLAVKAGATRARCRLRGARVLPCQ